jgi:hypothetical protein
MHTCQLSFTFLQPNFMRPFISLGAPFGRGPVFTFFCILSSLTVLRPCDFLGTKSLVVSAAPPWVVSLRARGACQAQRGWALVGRAPILTICLSVYLSAAPGLVAAGVHSVAVRDRGGPGGPGEGGPCGEWVGFPLAATAAATAADAAVPFSNRNQMSYSAFQIGKVRTWLHPLFLHGLSSQGEGAKKYCLCVAGCLAPGFRALGCIFH